MTDEIRNLPVPPRALRQGFPWGKASLLVLLVASAAFNVGFASPSRWGLIAALSGSIGSLIAASPVAIHVLARVCDWRAARLRRKLVSLPAHVERWDERSLNLRRIGDAFQSLKAAILDLCHEHQK
jgi:hypothetical protein